MPVIIIELCQLKYSKQHNNIAIILYLIMHHRVKKRSSKQRVD